MESRDLRFDQSAEDEALALLGRDQARALSEPVRVLEGLPPGGLLPGSGRAELTDWDEPEYPRRRNDEDDEADDHTHD